MSPMYRQADAPFCQHPQAEPFKRHCGKIVRPEQPHVATAFIGQAPARFEGPKRLKSANAYIQYPEPLWRCASPDCPSTDEDRQRVGPGSSPEERRRIPS